MKLLDRLREQELVRTNDTSRFPIGSGYVLDGVHYRITRHKEYPTMPWSTIVVYGVRVA